MIKLNLLPRYLIEMRRLKVMSLCFGIVFALICGVIFKAYTDLKAQTAWYDADKAYYTEYTKAVNDASAASKDLASKSGVYPEYNRFFTRQTAQANVDQLAMRIVEAANAVSGQGAWYRELTIADKNVSLQGEMNGLMNFVNYYFYLKDKGFNVAPAAHPHPFPNTMQQRISLAVSGELKEGLPKALVVPKDSKPQDWKKMYISIQDRDQATTSANTNIGRIMQSGK